MADEGNKKQFVSPVLPVPGERELFVLHAVHHLTDRIVLLPILFNGEPRFALALLCCNAEGEPYLRVLANLLQPADEVLDRQGCTGYNSTPPMRKDLN